MATKLECPECGQHLETEEMIDELIGVEVTCPSCNGSFIVSEQQEAATPSSVPTTSDTARNNLDGRPDKKRIPYLPLILGIFLFLSLVTNGVLTWRFATNSPNTPTPSNTSTVGFTAQSKPVQEEEAAPEEPEVYYIKVTVRSDGYPKYPAQFELYRNGKQIEVQNDDRPSVVFNNVEVRKGDKLSAKVGWRNAIGAILRYDRSDESTVYSDRDRSIYTSK